MLGVNALTQSAALQALKIGDAGGRAPPRAAVIEQRRRLEAALHDLPVDAPPSQANFVWLRRARADRMRARRPPRARRASLVAPGGPLGADDHVRAAIRGAAATACCTR